MYGTVVGVLRGGPSREHEVSLLSGHALIANLPRDRYTVRDIYIDKNGTWHERGKPSTPADILRSVDVVVNGLHGEYGEDGEVQRMLERFNIPYTGSDSFASRITMHKAMAKEKAKELGIKTAKYLLIEQDTDPAAVAYEVVRTFHQPVVVKPVKGSLSAGVHVVGGYAPLYAALDTLLNTADVIIEEFIRGTEASAGVVEDIRDEGLYALPPTEIVPIHSNNLTFQTRFGSKRQEICPGRFSKEIALELQETARKLHEAFGLRHYSRSDFVVSPRGIYYLETNTLPELTKESTFTKSLSAVGIPFSEFTSHIVELARV